EAPHRHHLLHPVQLASARRLDGAGAVVDLRGRPRRGGAGARHGRCLPYHLRRRAHLGAQARRRLPGREDPEAARARPARSGARPRPHRPIAAVGSRRRESAPTHTLSAGSNLVSRTHAAKRNATREPAQEPAEGTLWLGPGSAPRHFMLRRVRGTSVRPSHGPRPTRPLPPPAAAGRTRQDQSAPSRGDPMNLLLIGSGGREHALAWKLTASPLCDRLFIAPGNPGTALCGDNVALDVTDHAAIVAFCRDNAVGLV